MTTRRNMINQLVRVTGTLVFLPVVPSLSANPYLPHSAKPVLCSVHLPQQLPLEHVRNGTCVDLIKNSRSASIGIGPSPTVLTSAERIANHVVNRNG